MMSSAFLRYELRTTNPDAARRFYHEVVELDLATGLSSDASSILVVWPLHEQARARGATAHWLGSVGVVDVDATVGRLIGHGSQPLGPTQLRAQDGTPFAILRDPFGALVSVRGRTRRPEASPIAWHQLHTEDLDRAWTLYSELFGWSPAGTAPAPDVEGGHRIFSWDASGESVGSIANTARVSGIHAHWLYYFRVADLDASAAKVKAHGGRLLASAHVLPNGDRLWPCEDAQGAAFGLYARAT